VWYAVCDVDGANCERLLDIGNTEIKFNGRSGTNLFAAEFHRPTEPIVVLSATSKADISAFGMDTLRAHPTKILFGRSHCELDLARHHLYENC